MRHLIPAVFAVAALFSYSLSFSAAFSMPKLMIYALGLLPMAWYVCKDGKIDLRPAIFWHACVLGAVMAVSCCLGPEPWLGLVGRYNSYALGLLGLAIALAYHVGSASAWGSGTGIGYDKRGLRLIAAACAVLGVYAFAQYGGLFGNAMFKVTGDRAIGTIGSPTDLGLILALVFPIACELSPVYGVAIALGLVASGSRGAWVGAGAGMMVYAFRLKADRLRAGVAVSVLIVGVLAFAWKTDRPWSKSDAERVNVWKIAAAAVKESPIMGNGPDSFEQAFRRFKTAEYVVSINSDRFVQADAHNDILQVLSTLGIMGLLAYAVLLLSITRMLLLGGSVHAAVLGGMAALFVNAKFSPVSLESIVTAAVILGMVKDYRKSNTEPLPLARHLQIPLFVAASFVFAFVMRIGVADFYGGQTYLYTLQRAAELNPFELTYKSRLINTAISELNRTDNVELQSLILDEMKGQAQQALRLRPGNSRSWYMAGIVAATEIQAGRKMTPVYYLERARRLDPLFGPIRSAIVEARKL